MTKPSPTPCIHNRLYAVLRHTRRYAFRSQIRLARDAGVSRSVICRLLAGSRPPSFDVALTVVALLEREIGRPLPLCELFSFDGTYPTPSLCQVVGCAGCLPEEVYAADETLRPPYRSLHSGEWPDAVTPLSPDDTS